VIISRLEGGLGNQMFQYAAGLRLATARNTRLKLDLSGLDDPTIRTPRSYELDAFAVTAELASPSDIEPIMARSGGLIGGLAARWPRDRSRPATVERTFCFDPQVLLLPDGVCLRGYWQSERYFEDVSDLVREELTFRASAVGRNAETLKEIAACNSVSLHVRRGDYMTDPAVYAMHGVCSIDYYHHAVDHIRERVANPTFYLFSDEPEWVRENLDLGGSVRLVDHNGPEDGSEDLRLMSRCAHHIIANSTFSWWGAWLNPGPDKIVIAPKRWFADDSLDTSDLLPASWVKL
jgi:hypothetical protein